MLWEGVNISEMAASVYQAAARRDEYQVAIDIAEKHAEALKEFPTLSSALFWRTSFFWYFQRPDRDVDEAIRFARKTNLPGGAQYFCALILYRRGSRRDLEQARTVLEAGRGNAPMDLVRCCVMAELESPDSALQAHGQMAARILHPKYQLLSYSVLFLLGRKDLVREASRQDRLQGLHFNGKSSQTLLEYFAGQLSDVDMLEAIANAGSRWERCNAHYFMGLSLLCDGNRIGALEHFQKVKALGTFSPMSFDLGMVFLSRLEKDRAWPPWIPVKK